MSRSYGAFRHAMRAMAEDMILLGQDVEVETWQGEEVKGRPDFMTRELLDYRFRMRIPWTKDEADRQIKPDQPWADAHFKERVSGIPMNPGSAYRTWPWHTANPDRFLDEWGKFEVSYMERLWSHRGEGIRYPTGSMQELLDLLQREPYTRKAYLPLFWPEDTGRTGRTMCSLGYHFLRRHGQLHLWYDLRSCDVVRHLANDVYFAVRTLQWVLDQLNWEVITPGHLHFTAHSLHYHKGDEHHYRAFVQKYAEKQDLPRHSEPSRLA